MTKKIRVTQNSIRRGIRIDAQSCPVARAMKSAGLRGVFVFGSRMYFLHKGQSIYFKASKKVDNFTEAFDAGRKVKPFEFTIRHKV